MKKRASWLLLLVLIVSVLLTPAGVASAASKMNDRETAVVKSYMKSLETGKISYLNKYKYPGINFKQLDYSGTLSAKMFSTKYSKTYENKEKLDCLYASGILVASTKDELAIVKGKMGIYVKTKNKTIYAYKENKKASDNMKEIGLNDLTEKQLKAITDYLVDLYGKTKATDLLGTLGDSSEGDTNTEDTNTSEFPIPLGKSYTWSENYTYVGHEMSSNYSLSISKVKNITFNEIEAFGFKKPTDEVIEYKLVTVKWVVKSTKVVSADNKNGLYKSMLTPNIWGSMADNGQYIIGATDYGFDGSINRKMTDVVGFDKIYKGDKTSFTVEGQILLPVIKGETNYMVLKDRSIEDYNESKIQFKLK